MTKQKSRAKKVHSERNCDPKFLKQFLSNHMLEYTVDNNGAVMFNKEPDWKVIRVSIKEIK